MATIRRYKKEGITVSLPIGFSWTSLFFGPFPALFRGDIKWGAIQLVVHILVAFLTLGITLGIGNFICWVVFAAIYNGRYERDFLLQGFKPLQDGVNR